MVFFSALDRYYLDCSVTAEQVELVVRMHQIRVAQAEARAAAVVSSEAVAQESPRQAQDRRMQEWTRFGTPVPAIGEDQVLLGTPVIGWGPLVITVTPQVFHLLN